MALSHSNAVRFSSSAEVRRRAQRLLEATSIAYGAPDILSMALGHKSAPMSGSEKKIEGLAGGSVELR